MNKHLRLSLPLFVLFVISFGEALAGNFYYVRNLPGVGGNGTSYAAAWYGLSDVAWGTLQPGDTLFICGRHTNGQANGDAWIRPTVSGAPGNPIVIDGACVDNAGNPDPGEVYAVHMQLSSAAWNQDPHGNGIYSQSYAGSTGSFVVEGLAQGLDLELTRIWPDPNSTATPKEPLIPWDQWPDGSFYQANSGTTVYYKPSTGVAIGTRSVHAQSSDILVIDGQHDIVVRNIKLHGSYSRVVSLSNADNITIEDSDLRRGLVWVTNDSDFGILQRNEIHHTSGEAILMYPGNVERPVDDPATTVDTQSNDGWLIARNHIYHVSPDCAHCSPTRTSGGDRHAIGIQSGNRIKIEYNHIHDVGGTAVTFYNRSNHTENDMRVGNLQRDNTIRYNFIHDVEDKWPGCVRGVRQPGEISCASERGIELGSDSQPAPPDTVTGNLVHHNVLARIKRIALKFKATIPDTGHGWRILNNVVYQSGIGASLLASDSNDQLPHYGAEYRNNLFLYPTGAHMELETNKVESADSRNLVDQNFYFPDGLLFRTFEAFYNPDVERYHTLAQWQALLNYDSASLTADPLLTDVVSGDFHWTGTPSVITGAGDFRPTASSPVIDRGTDVGFPADTRDIAGNLLQGIPDIGAYEAPGPDLVPTALTATITGTTLRIDDAVQNQGTAAAGAFDIKFYLSSDTVYQASTDVFVCQRSVASLDAGAFNPVTGTQRTTCTTPAGTLGYYYVLAVDDAGNTVAENNEANNTRATAAPLNIGPDLTHTLLSAVKSGNNVLITDTVRNQGNQSAGSFRISFYLSTDTTYQAGTDISLCYRTVSSLASGASNNRQNGNCVRPAGASYGVPYHVIAVDDSLSAIAESDETNNIRATTGTVQW